MLTEEGLLNLLDRIKEAVKCGSEFGLIRYEAHEGQYIVHAQMKSFAEESLDKEIQIAAI